MRSKILFLILTGILYLAQCHTDKTIVVTKACASANRNLIAVGDTIIFTNCSEADYTTIGFKVKGANLQTTTPPNRFDSQNRYMGIFSDTGTFQAIVQTHMNAGNYISKMDSSVSFRVHP